MTLIFINHLLNCKLPKEFQYVYDSPYHNQGFNLESNKEAQQYTLCKYIKPFPPDHYAGTPYYIADIMLNRTPALGVYTDLICTDCQEHPDFNQLMGLALLNLM